MMMCVFFHCPFFFFFFFCTFSGIPFSPEYLHSDDEEHDRYDDQEYTRKKRTEAKLLVSPVIFSLYSINTCKYIHRILGCAFRLVRPYSVNSFGSSLGSADQEGGMLAMNTAISAANRSGLLTE